jgi:glucosamine--fructose-6-phosphate aminotransferase (isomerizing)
MCGIFGYISSNKNTDIYNIILNGLIQLQNRGYDSAGIGVINNNNIIVKKYASDAKNSAIDKLKNIVGTEFKNELIDDNIYMGIGHNRWATHGEKNDTNAHPHVSYCGLFMLIHNGIIENYNNLKEFLISKKYVFKSQTDTEVIVNLISYHYSITNNTEKAIKNTINELVGTYGLIIVNRMENLKLFCVRNGSPLLIGINDNIGIITSEQSGFCNLIGKYIALNNDDICILSRINNSIFITTSREYVLKNININKYELTPKPYKFWTVKEINDQPNTILNAINNGGRIKNSSEVKLGGLESKINILKDISNIILLGCGTSYFAGLYAVNFFKRLCNFNTVLIIDGADFNHLDIPKYGKTALVLISQSGETKDLHRCIDIAKNNNLITIGTINVVDSLIAREVDCGIYLNAGREVAVASTKAFTSQVICLSLMAIWFAQIHNLNEKMRIDILNDLKKLSINFGDTIKLIDDKISNIAEKLVKNNIKSMFVLGKGRDESVAKEGSLKIKEISYIHAEGYSASSLKHGPFALLDRDLPVIIINCDNEHNSKVHNCIEEVKSRNTPIIYISTDIINDDKIDCIKVLKNESYQSLLSVIPLQLLAYNLSIKKGINPDIPKNLAKVVTVE